MIDNLVSLAHLPRELADLTGTPPLPYRRLYREVLDGNLPAIKTNGRWYFRRGDLPLVAEIMGLSAFLASSA